MRNARDLIWINALRPGLSVAWPSSATWKGSTWGRAQSFGIVYFTALEELNYELSGALSYSGSGAIITQTVTLLDDTTSSFLFNSSSGSLPLSGSGLTGSLTQGHNYRLSFDYILTHNLYNQTRNGSGDLLLSLAPVPEPGAGLLVTTGLLVWRSRDAGESRRASKPHAPTEPAATPHRARPGWAGLFEPAPGAGMRPILG